MSENFKNKREIAKNKLIVALDYSKIEDAKKLVEELGEDVVIYKVGLELFLNTNGEIIDYLHDLNKKVFLDLKFHDITNTVKMACNYAINRNVFMFNIHCSNGSKTMKEVAKLVEEKKSNSIVIGVTVLTNLSQDDVDEMFKSTMKLDEMVKNFAQMVKKSGLHGIVSSPHEAKMIKETLGDDFVTVCPGVRPTFSLTDDQERIMTPFKAIKNNVDYLVVGRPITKNENPKNATNLILDEIEEALI